MVRKIVVGLVAVGMVPQLAFAGLMTINSADGWEDARSVVPYSNEQVIFGRLVNPGQSHFVTWENTTAHKVRITIAVPKSASTDFHPRLAIFEPSHETIGPLLPMDQPPQTLAAIYPANQDQAVFEGLTQTQYTVRLSLDLTLEKVGQYYLAVYNADRVSGSYRLTITSAQSDTWAAVTSYPSRWWTSHAWAGLSIRTIFLPTAVVGCLAVVWWLVVVRTKVPVKSTRKIRR